MRRRIQFTIGVLEAVLASILFVIGWQLPRPHTIESTFGRVEHVTRNAEMQVRLMREQVEEVRQKDFPRVAAHLRAQTRGFSEKWKDAASDFPSFDAMNELMAASAVGFDHWSVMLDPADLSRDRIPAQRQNRLGHEQVQQTRDVLEECAAQIESDSRKLQLTFGQPIDASTIVHAVVAVDSIQNRIDRLYRASQSDEAANLRELLVELESTIALAHQQVETVSSAAFPLFVPNGNSNPAMQMVPIWPQGKAAARTLGNALIAVRALRRQMDDLILYAQDIRTPNRNGTSLFPVDQGPGRLRLLASALQRSSDELQRALSDWPQYVENMRIAAQLLHSSHEQLDELVARRPQYERMMQRGGQVTRSAEDLLENYSHRLDARLGEQERSLSQMEKGLAEASEAIPEVSNTTVALLNAIRWMFWLVGAMLALHSALVICVTRKKPLAA